jgi:hypothetical protein
VELEKYLEQQGVRMLVVEVVELLELPEQVVQVVGELVHKEMVELKQQQELQTLAVVVAVEQEQIVVVEIMVDPEL